VRTVKECETAAALTIDETRKAVKKLVVSGRLSVVGCRLSGKKKEIGAVGRASQAEIKAKADEWARKGAEIERAEAARDRALEPFVAEYSEKAAPVLAKHEPKISRLMRERTEIEAEVLGWLNGAGKPLAINGELAVAANEVVVGKRTIDATKFFDRVKERSAAFWDCVTIGIAKAEKLIGATAVDEIAGKETRLVASLKRK